MEPEIISPWKRRNIYKPLNFRFHVKFLACTCWAVPSRKLTCTPKRDYFNRKYIWTHHWFSGDMLVPRRVTLFMMLFRELINKKTFQKKHHFWYLSRQIIIPKHEFLGEFGLESLVKPPFGVTNRRVGRSLWFAGRLSHRLQDLIRSQISEASTVCTIQVSSNRIDSFFLGS